MSYVGFVNYNSGGNKPIAHTLYGSCSTAAATAAKTVTLADFDKLLDGVTIKIKFTYANTAASPTLNINSTGAKAIQKASGTAVAAADSWKAGQVVSFTYDNTAGAWIMNDFRDYASTSAPGIVKLESTPTFNLTAKGSGSSSNVVTTSGLYAAYDNLLGAIGTETLNSGFGSNVSIKAAINSLYTTCIGASLTDSFNARYTGFELSSTVASTGNNGSLWNSIKSNIKGIGDYFWIKLNNTNVRCRIAGRNIYKICGDTALTTNHYAIVTDTPFQTAAYYPANDTSGGTKSSGNTSTKGAFLGSDMWNLTLGANPSTGAAVTTTGINNTLYSIFGSSLIKYRDMSTSSINKTAISCAGNGLTGSSNNSWVWHDCYATLLNECEVYGGPVFSSSAYDIGIKKAQLPLFTLNPELIILKNDPDTGSERQWYWLKNVASGSAFCACADRGRADFSGASDSGGLRLEFQLSI